MLWRCWLGGRKGIRPVKIWSDEVMAWLSVWSEVQMICLWFSRCHCHPVISCFSKIQNGLSSWYPGCPGKKAVKRLCVCILYNIDDDMLCRNRTNSVDPYVRALSTDWSWGTLLLHHHVLTPQLMWRDDVRKVWSKQDICISIHDWPQLCGVAFCCKCCLFL